MLAELHARWEREENSIARVYTFTTTSNANVSHASKPPTINGKIIGVGNVSTTTAKRLKLPENTETIPDKVVESLRIVDDGSTTIDHDAFDFDECNIS